MYKSSLVFGDSWFIIQSKNTTPSVCPINELMPVLLQESCDLYPFPLHLLPSRPSHPHRRNRCPPMGEDESLDVWGGGGRRGGCFLERQPPVAGRGGGGGEGKNTEEAEATVLFLFLFLLVGRLLDAMGRGGGRGGGGGEGAGRRTGQVERGVRGNSTGMGGLEERGKEPTHPPTHPPTRPPTHALTHPLLHPPINALTHPLSPPPNPPTHPPTHLLNQTGRGDRPLCIHDGLEGADDHRAANSDALWEEGLSRFRRDRSSCAFPLVGGAGAVEEWVGGWASPLPFPCFRSLVGGWVGGWVGEFQIVSIHCGGVWKLTRVLCVCIERGY